ncbi:ABC transporter substrate-binding protein [Caulobacter sp. SLTY]|nr:ABC transporter substrate-binding protein [Caulobacter sp. SLTY]NBB15362.1 ABC transporter substrate-binding protein [Caulobacter sp. SLTY]
MLAGTAVVAALAGGEALAARVVSLDQCADQYVLALAPRKAIVGLSHRADDADSHLRDLAKGLPQRRVTAEGVLAARPTLVVRYWGGDARLDEVLAKRGVASVRIEDAIDFDGVRANIVRVAGALGEPERGQALIARMDARLAASAGAWKGREALYLTPSGYTAGPGTFIDRILAAAGLRNAARPGFTPVSLETVVMGPERGFVLGFFDKLSAAFERWGMGRHRAVQKRLPERTLAAMPASVLSCPAWFAAEGVEALAKAAPGR